MRLVIAILLLLFLCSPFVDSASYTVSQITVNIQALNSTFARIQIQRTGLATADASVWLAVAVADSSGQMPNSDMMLGWCAADGTATASPYQASGHIVPSVTTPDYLLNKTCQVVQASDGTWTHTLGFTRPLAVSGLRTMPTQQSQTYLYASGDRSGASLSQHSDGLYGSFSFASLDSGSTQATTSSVDVSRVSHAVLMLLAWLVLLPAGIFLARYGKHQYPGWYKWHRNVQAAAVGFTIISFIIIYVSRQNFEADLHPILGVTVLCLSLVQVALGHLSNMLWYAGKPPHWLHDRLHWYLGRLLSLLALINIWTAVTMNDSGVSNNGRTLMAVGLTIWMAAILCAFVVLERRVGQQHESLNQQAAVPVPSNTPHPPGTDDSPQEITAPLAYPYAFEYMNEANAPIPKPRASTKPVFWSTQILLQMTTSVGALGVLLVMIGSSL